MTRIVNVVSGEGKQRSFLFTAVMRLHKIMYLKHIIVLKIVNAINLLNAIFLSCFFTGSLHLKWRSLYISPTLGKNSIKI